MERFVLNHQWSPLPPARVEVWLMQETSRVLYAEGYPERGSTVIHFKPSNTWKITGVMVKYNGKTKLFPMETTVIGGDRFYVEIDDEELP